MLVEKRKQIENLFQQLMVLLSDLNEVEKTFSRIRNEAKELRKDLNELLNGN